MKSWILNILGLAVSWHFADPDSDSFFRSTILPGVVAIFLATLLIRFLLIDTSGNDHSMMAGGSGDSSGGSSGGDCGGDSGSC